MQQCSESSAIKFASTTDALLEKAFARFSFCVTDGKKIQEKGLLKSIEIFTTPQIMPKITGGTQEKSCGTYPEKNCEGIF